MFKRPDSIAVVGLLAVAALLGVGALVLIGLGNDVPAELWALVAASLGAVGGWIGKASTVEVVPGVTPPDAYAVDPLTRTGQ